MEPLRLGIRWEVRALSPFLTIGGILYREVNELDTSQGQQRWCCPIRPIDEKRQRAIGENLLTFELIAGLIIGMTFVGWFISFVSPDYLRSYFYDKMTINIIIGILAGLVAFYGGRAVLDKLLMGRPASWHIVIVSGSLLGVMLVLIFVTGGGLSPYKALVLMPILTAGLNHGKKPALILAGLATFVLGVIDIVTGNGDNPNSIFQGDLLLFGLLFLLAWFLGGMADIETETREELVRLANLDDLTGLANHRCFHDQLEYEMEMARNTGRGLTLVFFDINNFRTFNYANGYQRGDECLKELAQVLKPLAPANALLAHYGRDEFGLILPGASEVEAAQLAGQMKQAVDEGIFPGEEVLPGGRLTVATIITPYLADYKTRHDLLAAADEALLDVKFNNPDRVGVYTSVLKSVSPEASDWDPLIIGAVRALTAIINARDHYTAGHSERVAIYSVMLGRRLGLGLDEMKQLEQGGFLHDIGKIELPAALLRKKGYLSKAEWDLVTSHPKWGANIIYSTGFLRHLLHVVQYHHENYDGTGYPGRLGGTQIPLVARIVRVADTFDAITTNRPYKKSLKYEEAIAELEKCAGKQLDPNVVKEFRYVYTSDMFRDQEAT